VDDGAESAHTWEAAQDTNITVADNQARLLRVLVNTPEDPGAQAFTLRAQKNGTGGYAVVGVGSTTDVTPTPDSGDATESGDNTASTSWALSVPNASTNDLLIFCISWDDSTACTDVTEPSGQNSETLSEVNATPATDSGTETRCKVWYCKCTGAWTAGTITFTPAASEQWTGACIRIPAGEFDSTTPIGASGTRNSTADGANIQHAAFSAGGSDGGGRLCVWTSADTDPIKQKRLLNIILDDVQRLDRLITDISEASRVDSEMSRSDRTQIDLTRLLAALAQIYVDQQQAHGVRIEFLVDPTQKLMVSGFETRLVQVFRNLIDNAVSFSPPEGVITVELKADGDMLVTTVSDEGTGIPPDRIEKIFDRFYTDRPQGEKFGKHSGLGLSICRQIIAAMGGKVWAENRKGPTGKTIGATFTVTLPRA
jgi:two-component sensor histidine kinase